MCIFTQFFIDEKCTGSIFSHPDPPTKNYANKSAEWNMTKWQMTRLANKIICFIFSHPQPARSLMHTNQTQYIIDNKATNFWHFYDCPRTVNWNQTICLNGRSDTMIIGWMGRWWVLIKNNHIFATVIEVYYLINHKTIWEMQNWALVIPPPHAEKSKLFCVDNFCLPQQLCAYISEQYIRL